MWADSHCHLPYEGLEDVAAHLAAAREAGVHRMVSVGTDAAQSAAAVAVAEANDGVWATVGLHPHDATDGVDSVLPLLGPDRSPVIVGIGECGLDYHYEHSPRDVQREAFAAQIRLATELDLALVIHTREAWDDTWAVLEAEGVPERTVFHCFTGGPDEARECLDRGAFLSFSGIVTFKAAADVQDAARLCPLERMLAETDSPYLAPVPHRGRRNEPAYVAATARFLAELRGVTHEELGRVTSENFSNLFRVGPG